MSEPRTAAGRALLVQVHLMHKRWPATDGLIGRHDILAIEDEDAQIAAPAEGLRDAAFRVVTLTDNLRQWDESHGHVIKSERDEIAGWLDAAWDDLRAALARPADVLDVEP
jgi:hypothetical protein